MPTFVKKPVEIEAVQFTGKNVNEIWDAFSAADVYGPTEDNPNYLIISTLEGEMKCQIDDWVIKGVQGELYPCKPDIFEQTYSKIG